MIRLVASDIDGTLLQGGARALSDELFGLIRVRGQRAAVPQHAGAVCTGGG